MLLDNLIRIHGTYKIISLMNSQMVMLEDQDNDKQKRAIPRQYLYDIVFGEASTQVN